MSIRLPLVSLLAAGLLMSACADETGLAEGSPPLLPAVETMLFDLEFFGGGGPAPAAAPQRVAGLHWTAAALSVAVANLAVVIHTVVPVATWRAAMLQIPVFEDGRWHWGFSTASGGATYSGDLAGFTEDGDAVFEMRVSASALGLTDFLWYRGRAPLAGTTGEWQFFDPESPTSVTGRIEWSHPQADTWTLTFIATSGENSGDELMYEVAGTGRTVTFSDASTQETAEIHWDRDTLEGHIIAPNYNGGGKSCWDGTLANTTCAP